MAVEAKRQVWAMAETIRQPRAKANSRTQEHTLILSHVHISELVVADVQGRIHRKRLEQQRLAALEVLVRLRQGGTRAAQSVRGAVRGEEGRAMRCRPRQWEGTSKGHARKRGLAEQLKPQRSSVGLT